MLHQAQKLAPICLQVGATMALTAIEGHYLLVLIVQLILLLSAYLCVDALDL